jgi:hypothetical protein
MSSILAAPIAPSYMSPNAGGSGGVGGLSLRIQLYTGAQINFGDLTPSLTYVITLKGRGVLQCIRVRSVQIHVKSQWFVTRYMITNGTCSIERWRGRLPNGKSVVEETHVDVVFKHLNDKQLKIKVRWYSQTPTLFFVCLMTTSTLSFSSFSFSLCPVATKEQRLLQL